MEQKEIKQKCLNLMETANAIYLSTNGGDGYPRTRMMSYQERCHKIRFIYKNRPIN